MASRAGRLLFSLGLLAFLVLACHSESRSAARPGVPEKPPAEASPPAESVPTPVIELSRADVVQVVDAGLGRFLQDIEVKAVLKESRFIGFRIVQIRNRERFRGVGLEPGDVIVLVNGRPIEHEGEAFEVFQSLRTAPYLEVEYLRGGEKMRLSLPIVGEAPKSSGTGGATQASSGGGPS